MRKIKRKNEDRMSPLDIIQILLDLIVATGILILCIYIYQTGTQKVKEKFIKDLAERSGVKQGAYELVSFNEVSENVLSANTVSSDSKEETAEPFEPGKNFRELKNLNPDIKAWLEVPGTPIDYPVLYSDELDGEEEYYLRKNYLKKKDSHGSIFIKTGCNYDLTDDVTVIYGHNMKDGSMFGTVHRMATSITAVRPPYLVLYYPDKTVYAELLACYTTDTQLLSDKFNDFRSAQDRMDYIYSFDNKTPLCDLKEKDIVNGKEKIITLSTCTGGGEQRELAQFIITRIDR